MTEVMREALERGVVPEEWGRVYLRPIHKGGDMGDPSNYRGISFISHGMKIMTGILAREIMERHGGELHEGQYGFREGRSCEQAVGQLMEYVEKRGGKGFALFVDFAKAFDSVPREGLIERLGREYGMREDLVGALRTVLAPNRIVIDDGVERGRPIIQGRGLPQGDSLSPLLFIMYVNSILKRINKGKTRAIMYADDLVIVGEKREELQVGAYRLEEESRERGLSINVGKTKWMALGKGGVGRE